MYYPPIPHFDNTVGTLGEIAIVGHGQKGKYEWLIRAQVHFKLESDPAKDGLREFFDTDNNHFQ